MSELREKKVLTRSVVGYEEYDFGKKTTKYYDKIAEAAADFGCSNREIVDCCTGKCESIDGVRFCFTSYCSHNEHYSDVSKYFLPSNFDREKAAGDRNSIYVIDTWTGNYMIFDKEYAVADALCTSILNVKMALDGPNPTYWWEGFAVLRGNNVRKSALKGLLEWEKLD